MMSITAVKSYFKELGLEDRVLEFSVSSATVALAGSRQVAVRKRGLQKPFLSLSMDMRC